MGIINRKNEFKESIDIGGVQKSGFEWLVELYPELNTNRLREGKVIDTKKHSIKVRVKLRKRKLGKGERVVATIFQSLYVGISTYPRNN